MTTAIFNAIPSMASDATFRAWGSAVSAQLAAVGLVQTADTGQINWATVVRSGGAGSAGYEIWRFNDALQATAPIFMRIEYGSASVTNVPGIRFQVGIGSNGSGTLTAPTTTLQQCGVTNSGSSAINKTSKMAYNGGSFAFLGFDDVTGAGWPQMFMAVSRTYDVGGAYDGNGVQTYREKGGPTTEAMNTQSINFSTASAQTEDTNGNYSFIPGVLTSTAVSGVPQVYAHFCSLPEVKVVPGMVTVNNNDVAVNTTFSAAVVGATARTYVKLSTFLTGAAVATNAAGVAMIWE